MLSFTYHQPTKRLLGDDMSSETRNMLHEHIMSKLETFRELYAAHMNDAPYFADGLPDDLSYDPHGGLVDADGNEVDPDDYEAVDPFDVLHESALDVVDERGRDFAVVFTVGGPHIELTASGLETPHLVGYWGGETVTAHDSEVLEWVMDSFIDRD